MLIEFRVANFKSIQERQVLSLRASKGRELTDSHTFGVPPVAGGPDINMKLLRSAALYGANAAGKSNFLQAMRAMQAIVSGSALEKRRGDPLPVAPFRLDPGARDAPSEFEAAFFSGGVRYQYGFAATTERIVEEWLFAYPRNRAQRWFRRAWAPAQSGYEWELGAFLSGEKALWQKATRDNALFLSTAVQLNSRQLQPVYDWFAKTLHLANVSGWSPIFSAELCETDCKEQVLNFLKAADLDIHDVRVRKDPFDPKFLPGDMSAPVKQMISEQMENKEVLEIQTVHRDSEGKEVAFGFDQESDGTQKVFSFAGPWIDSLQNGHVLFVDELHDNLHPQLAKFLVRRFHGRDTNPSNAQLVFTAHETSILSQDLMRRDQIWFCEKDRRHATRLYPLTDFHPRKGRENLELAYRSGRYGALPYIREAQG
ncbi:MAG: ATP-binding protein [Gammaproteobacteria bacterium]|nr:ATP-binding protein [Gammaproteobacteria bacterium]